MTDAVWIRGHKINDWILYTASFKIYNVSCNNQWGSIFSTKNISLEKKFYFNGNESDGGFYRSGGSYRSSDGNGWLMTNQFGNKVTDGGFPNFQILRGTPSSITGVITLWMFGLPNI